MSSIAISLQDNQYDVKVTLNDDGTKVYQFSTKTYVKNFGEANLSFSMTEDTYGNFVSASGSGTVVKDFGLIDFKLEADGEVLVKDSNLIGNLEAKANLDLDDELVPIDSSITVTEFKIQFQIPIEDLQNKDLANLEIASKASVFDISTDGPEVWAQDKLWNEWVNMPDNQRNLDFSSFPISRLGMHT